MSRKSKSHHSQDYIFVLYTMVIGFSLLAEPSVVLAADGIHMERASVSRHHVTGGRENPTKVAQTEEQYE